jgi:hypothetical protein
MINDPIAESAFSDDELQKALDYHRTHVRRERLVNDTEEMFFGSGYGNYEGSYSNSDETSAVWDNSSLSIRLMDGSDDSAVAVTPAGWNLVDGTFWFTSEQDTPLYLDGRSYDLHGTAADLFVMLAADQSRASRWTRGSVTHNAASLYSLALHHRNLAGGESTLVRRTYQK